MTSRKGDPLSDLVDLRQKTRVFRDRAHAGEALSHLMDAWRGTNALVLAVPCGGVPVAVELSRRLGLDLDVAPVAKMTPPGNTEIGYGAVAFDGTVRVNATAREALGISEADHEASLARAREKVERELAALREGRPVPELRHRPVIVVDDGIASGFTLEAAIEALKKAGAAAILLATPTGHTEALRRLGTEVNAVYCANIRSGGKFAVADAYQKWTDVTLEEAKEQLRGQAESGRT